jgi:hypothetical protein
MSAKRNWGQPRTAGSLRVIGVPGDWFGLPLSSRNRTGAPAMRRGSFRDSRATWSGQAYDTADAIDRKAEIEHPINGICCGRHACCSDDRCPYRKLHSDGVRRRIGRFSAGCWISADYYLGLSSICSGHVRRWKSNSSCCVSISLCSDGAGRVPFLVVGVNAFPLRCRG